MSTWSPRHTFAKPFHAGAFCKRIDRLPANKRRAHDAWRSIVVEFRRARQHTRRREAQECIRRYNATDPGPLLYVSQDKERKRKETGQRSDKGGKEAEAAVVEQKRKATPPKGRRKATSTRLGEPSSTARVHVVRWIFDIPLFAVSSEYWPRPAGACNKQRHFPLPIRHGRATRTTLPPRNSILSYPAGSTEIRCPPGTVMDRWIDQFADTLGGTYLPGEMLGKVSLYFGCPVRDKFFQKLCFSFPIFV